MYVHATNDSDHQNQKGTCKTQNYIVVSSNDSIQT